MDLTIIKDGKPYGPHTVEELRCLVQEGIIAGDTTVVDDKGDRVTAEVYLAQATAIAAQLEERALSAAELASIALGRPKGAPKTAETEERSSNPSRHTAVIWFGVLIMAGIAAIEAWLSTASDPKSASLGYHVGAVIGTISVLPAICVAVATARKRMQNLSACGYTLFIGFSLSALIQLHRLLTAIGN